MLTYCHQKSEIFEALKRQVPEKHPVEKSLGRKMYMSSPGGLLSVCHEAVCALLWYYYTHHTLIVLLQIVVASVGGVEGAYSMDKKWVEE